MKFFNSPLFRVGIFRGNEGVISLTSALSIKFTPSEGRVFSRKEKLQRFKNKILRGDENDYGVVCRKAVTARGVMWISDLIAADTNSVLTAVPTAGNMKYHAWGIGTTAATNTDTTLASASAPTDLVSDGPTAGTSVSASSGNNATYTSACTLTAGGSLAITEHGIFDGSGFGAVGTPLLDRHVFTAINVVLNDTITFTYVLTLTSNG